MAWHLRYMVITGLRMVAMDAMEISGQVVHTLLREEGQPGPPTFTIRTAIRVTWALIAWYVTIQAMILRPFHNQQKLPSTQHPVMGATVVMHGFTG